MTTAIVTYMLKQESTGKELEFRPYLVMEEKVLLLAKEEGQVKDIFRAVKKVLSACCLEEGFDVDTLPIFDIETLFLRLRAKSVSNVEKIEITDDKDGKKYMEIVDFEAITVKFPETKPDPIIKVGDLTIHMKYPSASIYEDSNEEIMKKLKTGKLFELVAACIDKVFDNGDLLPLEGDALNDFIDSLDIPTYKKLKEFLINMPRVDYRINYKNSLGEDRYVAFNSIVDFFFSV